MAAMGNMLEAMQQATDADRLVYNNDRCPICLHQYGLGDMICFFAPCLQHAHHVCLLQGWHVGRCPNCNLPYTALAVYAIHLDLKYTWSVPEDLNPEFNYPNQVAEAANEPNDQVPEPNDQEPVADEQWQMWLLYVPIFPFY